MNFTPTEDEETPASNSNNKDEKVDDPKPAKKDTLAEKMEEDFKQIQHNSMGAISDEMKSSFDALM